MLDDAFEAAARISERAGFREARARPYAHCAILGMAANQAGKFPDWAGMPNGFSSCLLEIIERATGQWLKFHKEGANGQLWSCAQMHISKKVSASEFLQEIVGFQSTGAFCGCRIVDIHKFAAHGVASHTDSGPADEEIELANRYSNSAASRAHSRGRH